MCKVWTRGNSKICYGTLRKKELRKKENIIPKLRKKKIINLIVYKITQEVSIQSILSKKTPPTNLIEKIHGTFIHYAIRALNVK